MKHIECFKEELKVIDELEKEETSVKRKEVLSNIETIIKKYEMIAQYLDVYETKNIGDLNPTYHASFNFENFIGTFQYMDLREMKRDYQLRREKYERESKNE